MILHFLYITCRKNSLFRGPAIEKAGRHTEKAAPGKSAARIAEKTERNFTMDTREIFERLDRVFQDVFDDDTIHVTPKTTADDIEDWDSLEHITLISAVEREFRMKFKMGEISSMKNVGEMASIIAARAKG